MLTTDLRDHSNATAGHQRCRRCNMRGDVNRPFHPCKDCDGHGWTISASWADTPYNEIIPNLFQGGCDYRPLGEDYMHHVRRPILPVDPFTVVYDLYAHDSQIPGNDAQYVYWKVPHLDGPLTDKTAEQFVILSRYVAADIEAGDSVLCRCQAGLNRSGLLTGLAMVNLGYPAETALALIRERRSPWAVCNVHFERFLLSYEGS